MVECRSAPLREIISFGNWDRLDIFFQFHGIHYTPFSVQNVNTYWCIYKMMITCCNEQMNEQDFRRKKLQAMVDSEGLSAVARKLKKPASQINDMLTCRKSFGEKVAREMEKNAGIADRWFDDYSTNIEPATGFRGRVPLISWVQAGDWSEIIDNFVAGDAEELLPCPVSHSENTFALRVRGESMYNPHGHPSFREGDLIYVDPNRLPVNGSLVVVRLNSDNEATFKKLVIEGEKRFLRPLNPDWPDQVMQVNNNAEICGVVIFKGEKF